jgi:putative nucleotidyltransferase with HDIG domain
MTEQDEEHPAVLERIQLAWHAARLWFVFALGLIGVIVALSLPISQRQTTFLLGVGDVAPQDILAPYALSYTSEILTEQAKEDAAESVAPKFDPPNAGVARQQLERLRATLEYIDSVRTDENATLEQQLEDLDHLADVSLTSDEARAVLELSEPRWEAVKLESISLLEHVMRNEIRDGRVEEARRSVPALVSISMPEIQAELASKLTSAFVTANTFLNEEATEAARQSATEAVSPVRESYAEGEAIVERGEVVSALDLEALRAFNLLKPPEPWQDIAIRTLLVLMMGSVLALYAYRMHAEQLKNLRLAFTISVLFVIMAVGLQLMIPGRTVLPYLFPSATLPILLTVIFSPGMGIMTALVSGALAGYLAPRGLEMTLFITLGGALSALVIGHAERLSSFFWAGLAAAVASMTIVVIFRFPDPATDLIGKATLLGASLLSGMLSSSLGFGLLLLVGNLLGMTTSLQLIELSRPDHPLLQYILRNSPGTYQHSLQVSNLAEQAARAIGANALLTRVGALYHDAGKAKRPQFFIENQMPDQNVHEQLDPTTSAGIIVDHVRDGLELARKYRLPKGIQAFILEHHGDMETGYQLNQALKAAGGEESEIDRSHFRYPGPAPQSRETALLMLADGVEAKARADRPSDEDSTDELVRWVIEDRLSKGQLDHVDLTLRDLDIIRRSFVNTLKNMYHPRIRYPGTTPEEENEAPATLEASDTPTEAA